MTKAHVRFDAPYTTSDGGALLLKSVDDKLGLAASLARCLVDPRESAKVRHSLVERGDLPSYGRDDFVRSSLLPSQIGSIEGKPLRKLWFWWNVLLRQLKIEN